MTPLLLPILTAALALVADAVEGGAEQPTNPGALLEAILSRWEQAGGQISELDKHELANEIHRLWASSGGWPVKVSWGELVEDPFQRRRAINDVALHWPELEADAAPLVAKQSKPGDVRASFNQVGRDDQGWYLVPGNNMVLLGLKVGDSIGDPHDAARPPRAYWRVRSTAPGRITLEPTTLNPLKSGVGAGGKVIDEYDLDVLSGRYEAQRMAAIRRKIDDGTATVDTVMYLLAGTVPTQMGPNGAQGGWYNAVDDRSNRGGYQGMSAEDIVLHDANWLQRHGLAAPLGALSGELPPYEWGKWVGGPMTDMPEEAIFDPDTYAKYIRKMVAEGRWRHTEEGIERMRRKASRSALEAHLDDQLQAFLANPNAEREAWDPQTLRQVVERGMIQLERQAKEQALQRQYDIAGEDSTNPASIKKHLYHPERRVSIRNAVLAVHYAELEHVDPERYPGWRDVLVDWIRWGKSDWLGYERAIKHFDFHGDIGALEAAAVLPDEDNRRYAIPALIRADPAVGLPYLQREPNAWARDWGIGTYAEEAGAAAALDVIDDWMPALLELDPEELDVVTRCQTADLMAKIEQITRKAYAAGDVEREEYEALRPVIRRWWPR